MEILYVVITVYLLVTISNIILFGTIMNEIKTSLYILLDYRFRGNKKRRKEVFSFCE